MSQVSQFREEDLKPAIPRSSTLFDFGGQQRTYPQQLIQNLLEQASTSGASETGYSYSTMNANSSFPNSPSIHSPSHGAHHASDENGGGSAHPNNNNGATPHGMIPQHQQQYTFSGVGGRGGHGGRQISNSSSISSLVSPSHDGQHAMGSYHGQNVHSPMNGRSSAEPGMGGDFNARGQWEAYNRSNTPSRSNLGKRAADEQLTSDRSGPAMMHNRSFGQYNAHDVRGMYNNQPVPAGLPMHPSHPGGQDYYDQANVANHQGQSSWSSLGASQGQPPVDGPSGISRAHSESPQSESSATQSPAKHGRQSSATSGNHTGGSSLRHPPIPPHSPGQPHLLRTSQLLSTGSGSNYGHNTNTAKAVLKLQGELNTMAMGWSAEEWSVRRRLVLFTRWQEGNTVNASFRPITLNEFANNNIVISCIFREDRNECFVTSVDTIYLLEALIGNRFTVEEKNRIRRNLEGFKPITVSKSKPESEGFFKLIMGFPNPKPRNIEKDVKVFPWKILGSAIQKIVGKYSAQWTGDSNSVPAPIGTSTSTPPDQAGPSQASTSYPNNNEVGRAGSQGSFAPPGGTDGADGSSAAAGASMAPSSGMSMPFPNNSRGGSIDFSTLLGVGTGYGMNNDPVVTTAPPSFFNGTAMMPINPTDSLNGSAAGMNRPPAHMASYLNPGHQRAASDTTYNNMSKVGNAHAGQGGQDDRRRHPQSRLGGQVPTSSPGPAGSESNLFAYNPPNQPDRPASTLGWKSSSSSGFGFSQPPVIHRRPSSADCATRPNANDFANRQQVDGGHEEEQ